MTEYVKLATAAGDQYLAVLSEIQDNFLKSTNEFVSALPPVPAAYTLPVASGVPTPREVADANFAFSEKLLKQQKAFTDKFLAIGSKPAHGKR